MGIGLPDPKQIIDSVGDGAVEVVEIGARLAEKLGSNLNAYGSRLKSIGDEIKSGTPDRPEVLPGAVIKAAGATVSAVVGTIGGFISAADETAKGLKSQIDRVVR